MVVQGQCPRVLGSVSSIARGEVGMEREEVLFLKDSLKPTDWKDEITD